MQLKELANLNFINQLENIIFIGNSGVGKTNLAVSLGIEVAKHRNSVYFITCHNLIQKLNKAQKEKSSRQAITAFSSIQSVDN